MAKKKIRWRCAGLVDGRKCTANLKPNGEAKSSDKYQYRPQEKSVVFRSCWTKQPHCCDKCRRRHYELKAQSHKENENGTGRKRAATDDTKVVTRPKTASTNNELNRLGDDDTWRASTSRETNTSLCTATPATTKKRRTIPESAEASTGEAAAELEKQLYAKASTTRAPPAAYENWNPAIAATPVLASVQPAGTCRSSVQDSQPPAVVPPSVRGTNAKISEMSVEVILLETHLRLSDCCYSPISNPALETAVLTTEGTYSDSGRQNRDWQVTEAALGFEEGNHPTRDCGF